MSLFKTEKRRTRITILTIIIIATLAFIWSNSLQSMSESQERSRAVTGALTPVLEIFVGKGHVTEHLVRKMAHFLEFGALGFELGLLALSRERVRFQHIANCLFIGLAAAVIDETIQIFSHRGSQVADVVLDFSGAMAGILLVLLVRRLAAAIRGRTQERKP